MSRLLVVEDEAHLAEGLRFNLEADGHSVEIVHDGEAALVQILEKNRPYDAIVLDVMLPGMNGFAVVSALRKAKNYVPVLILTARGRSEDVLQGFASGADDYLPKPFQLPIFLARLQGLLRRSEWLRGANDGGTGRAISAGDKKGREDSAAAEVFSFNGIKVDFPALELRASGATIQLTLMEAKLLRHLISHRGKTVSRKSILEKVWGLREDTDTRAIDNFIVRLRRYLEKDPSKPRHLLTVRGVGYRFVG